jgi:regulator of ribonuclease activity A
MGNAAFPTADLCDRYDEQLQVCEPLLRPFGGRSSFHGQVVTVKCFEDNSLVRELLGEDGTGKVLVVDGGGSLRCALLGDMLAELAQTHGWSGVVINGCVRDTAQIAAMQFGVMALASHPRKSIKHGHGQRDLRVRFAGVAFDPDSHLYCDSDGIVLSAQPLTLET